MQIHRIFPAVSTPATYPLFLPLSLSGFTSSPPTNFSRGNSCKLDASLNQQWHKAAKWRMTMLPNCSAAVGTPSPRSLHLVPAHPTAIPTVCKNKPSRSRRTACIFAKNLANNEHNENATGSWTFEFQVRYATTGQINDNKLVKFFPEGRGEGGRVWHRGVEGA